MSKYSKSIHFKCYFTLVWRIQAPVCTSIKTAKTIVWTIWEWRNYVKISQERSQEEWTALPLLLFLLSLTITESEANSNKNPMMRRAGLSNEERKRESHRCPSVPGSSSLKVELLGKLLLPVKVQGKTRILLPPHLLLLQTKKFNCFLFLFRPLVQIKLLHILKIVN